VFPLVLRSVKRLFSEGTVPAGLRLVDSTVSATGVMVGNLRAGRRDRQRFVRAGPTAFWTTAGSGVALAPSPG